MTMTKTLTMSWTLPTEREAMTMSIVEADYKIIEMIFDGKTEPEYKSKLVSNNTKQRRWRDQAAVEEWIEFMHYIVNKYSGSIVVGKVEDI